jgi:hypothetical protein
VTRYPAKLNGVLALLAAVAVVSCHPLDEGDGATPPPIGSIVGVWTINEVLPPGGLDPRCAAPPSPYLLYVAQNGNVITAQTGLSSTDPNVGSNGGQFIGTLNGSTLGIEGGNPGAAAGSTLQTARVAMVAGGCDALISGVRTVFYTEPGFACNGTLTFTGTRMIGSGCAGTLAATAVAESGTHNTEGTAQAVTRPAEVSGTITTAEEDWYSFTLPAGNTPVTIMLKGPAAPANIDLFLTDDTGMALTPATQSTSGSSREAVVRVLAVPMPGPATYKVRVVATALASSVSYTLLIQ